MLAGKFTRETRFEDLVRAGWNAGKAHHRFLDRVEQVEQIRFLESPIGRWRRQHSSECWRIRP